MLRVSYELTLARAVVLFSSIMSCAREVKRAFSAARIVALAMKIVVIMRMQEFDVRTLYE